MNIWVEAKESIVDDLYGLNDDADPQILLAPLDNDHISMRQNPLFMCPPKNQTYFPKIGFFCNDSAIFAVVWKW